MADVIIAFPKPEAGKSIKSALVKSGIPVNAVVTSGAQAIALANELEGGIVICGYCFSDMHYRELWEYLPREFEVLLIASPAKLEGAPSDMICLSMPIKVNELLSTVEMMVRAYERQRARQKMNLARKKAVLEASRASVRERSPEEKSTIESAKALLMERNNMSEEEAHRYLQKTSMDSGTSLVEMAETILKL